MQTPGCQWCHILICPIPQTWPRINEGNVPIVLWCAFKKRQNFKYMFHTIREKHKKTGFKWTHFMLQISQIIAIYGPMIDLYGPVPYVPVMVLMQADRLWGLVGGSWTLETFLCPVKWHRAVSRVPFRAQKSRDFLPTLPHASLYLPEQRPVQ